MALGTSLPGWLALGYFHHASMPDSFCLGRDASAANFLRQEFYLRWQLLGMVPLVQQALLMTLTMAPPLLLRPVGMRWRTTNPGERIGVILYFIAAYVGVWLPASVMLTLTASMLQSLFRTEHALAPALSLCIAMVWQVTPAKRQCLAACISRTAADLNSDSSVGADSRAGVQRGLRSGARHGLFCIGSCWFLMLVPLLVGDLHLLLMAIVTLILALERSHDTSIRTLSDTSNYRKPNTNKA